MKIKINSTVTWKPTQYSLSKTGTVIAFIPPGVSALELLKQHRRSDRSRCRVTTDVSKVNRYLIEVYVSNKLRLESYHYYAPRATVIVSQNNRHNQTRRRN